MSENESKPHEDALAKRLDEITGDAVCKIRGQAKNIKETALRAFIRSILDSAVESTREAFNEACRKIDGDSVLHAGVVHAADERIAKLEREVEVLRRYGNKDCTVMADEELANEPE